MAEVNLMELGIELVPKEQKQTISRLMQFYLYDFTRYLDLEVDRDGGFRSIPDLKPTGTAATISSLICLRWMGILPDSHWWTVCFATRKGSTT